MNKQPYRTNDPAEFHLLCQLDGNIEVWLHDTETTAPIRRFRRSEHLDQFEKICGYMCQFTDNCILDMQIENGKYNFTHVGSEWSSYFKLDTHRVLITIREGIIDVRATKQSVFAVGENIFEKLHPVDNEKVIKYLKGLKKFVLENVKNETLRGLIEKCFECEELK